MLTAVDRPWGRFFVIYEDQNQWLKRLIVYPGQSLSLQYHYEREEHWWTQDEGVQLWVSDSTWIPVWPNMVTHIRKGMTHRLANPTDRDIIVTEWAVGKVREDDIVRVADKYGRS